uniref:Ig-like domain-containing protein n=1 Tax=Electrophorus electricus TaxID=8005 RepID=A0A4W4DNT1_ELEEL
MCTSSMVMFLITGGQEFNMEGPDVPVVAAPGSDIILPCSIKPKASEQSHVSAVDMEVKWSRTDLNSAVVHHYMDKIDKNEDQDPSYRGRTALFKEELQYGNTSLLLKNVKVSDGGQYTCQVDSAHHKDHVSVLLKVEGESPCRLFYNKPARTTLPRGHYVMRPCSHSLYNSRTRRVNLQ